MPTLRIEWISEAAGLEPHLAAWDGLALQTPQQLPMLAGSWVLAQFRTMLQPGEHWECCLAFAGSELVGVLPLICRGRDVLGTKIQLLRTPFDLHTRSGDAVVKRGCETPVLTAFHESIGGRIPRFLACCWRGVAADSPTASLGANACRIFHILRQTAGYGSFLPVRGSLDEYRRRLGGKFRGSLNNGRNKLLKLKTPVFSRVADDAAGNGSVLDDFLRLEAAGWKGREGTAILLNPRLTNFYRELTTRLAARHWLEWHLLHVDGQLIAAELGVRFGRTLALVKMAYDEDFSACAPGNLLMMEIIERVWQEGATDCIDCLSDQPWHNHWRLEKREYLDIFLYPRRLVPSCTGYLPHRALLGLKSRPAILRIARQARSWLELKTSPVSGSKPR